MRQFDGALSEIPQCSIFSCKNLLRLRLFIQYCPCSIVITISVNKIHVSGAPEPPRPFVIIPLVSIWGAPDTTVTKDFTIFNESTILEDVHSIAQQNCCQSLDSAGTDLAQNISNHPEIESLSKQYRVDVSYSETRLVYSNLMGRHQPGISSLRHAVQAFLKGTILSRLMVTDLTLDAYSIQRPIFTHHHSLLTVTHVQQRLWKIDFAPFEKYFSRSCMHSICACHHTQRVILQTRNC